MTLIRTLNDITPLVGKHCFLAENATLIGDVVLGDRCSVWYQAVIRGDVNSIRIGDEVNIQDGAVIHCTYQKAATYIGNRVSIGHNAIVHGCRIEDDVLIGMGSIVMDHTHVPPFTLIAAGAVVLERSILESGWVYAGIPAKPVKKLNQEQFETLVRDTARRYIMYSEWYDSSDEN